MKPLLIINFKTYKTTTSKKLLKLIKSIKKTKSKFQIIVAPQFSDIYLIAKKHKIKTIAQHIDYFEPGKHTGYILPEDVKAAGAFGTILNHAEHQLDFKILKKTIERAKKSKLKTIVCAANLKKVKQIAKLKPYAIAYEVPELIGTGKSISKLRPKSVAIFVKNLNKKIIPLCGAGISTSEDIKLALKLGTKGVLLSSAITKARNPEKVIKNLIDVKA